MAWRDSGARTRRSGEKVSGAASTRTGAPAARSDGSAVDELPGEVLALHQAIRGGIEALLLVLRDHGLDLPVLLQQAGVLGHAELRLDLRLLLIDGHERLLDRRDL